MTHGIGRAGVDDAEAFLERLVRIDPAAVVRLRPAPAGIALWARLPWEVLVTRTVAGDRSDDATVGARALLAELSGGTGMLPERRDALWRWALPSASGATVETIPAGTVRGLGAAAERTLREAATSGLGSGRVVGDRVLRDALLDHVAIVIEAGDESGDADRIPVPQRLVQAVLRMGFLSGEEVRVLVAGSFVGLAAEYGVAWHSRTVRLMIRNIGRTDGDG
jgi:hypothetical protein